MDNTLVRNEQRKLTATYINGIALALIGVGVFAQVVAFAQNLTLSLAAMLVMICCGVVSVTLHWVARRVLGGLEE